MNLDDKICYCFHVPLRKLVNYARRERPPRASQMSQCLGAGTGCGWCIPILKKIHEQALAAAELPEPPVPSGLPETPDAYAAARKQYLKSPDKNVFD